jgi:formylglycine-generating enzyme required for sulfatase activity
VNPGAVEICNTLDDDCDQSIDEDEDGDGYDVCEDCFDGDATRFDGSTTPGLGDTTWVTICGDTYQMGSLAGNSNEEPLHQVTVPAFEMLQSEVTVAQYGQCGSCGVPSTDTYCNWDEVGYEDHPVNCVTWQQAVDYCTWVGGRLPTESEWEYAARSGGQDITYPWGDEEATCDYAVMDDDNHTYGCDTGRTWSVCSKSPAGDSDQGLCGLSGNVWEWVQDWYHGCYDCSQCPGDWDCDYSTVAPADGMAWEVPSGSERVIRGGGLVHDAFAVRASIRGASGPGGTAIDHGFRCAR